MIFFSGVDSGQVFLAICWVPPSVTVSEAAPDSTPGSAHEQEDMSLRILCLYALIALRWEPLLHVPT